MSLNRIQELHNFFIWILFRTLTLHCGHYSVDFLSIPILYPKGYCEIILKIWPRKDTSPYLEMILSTYISCINYLKYEKLGGDCAQYHFLCTSLYLGPTKVVKNKCVPANLPFHFLIHKPLDNMCVFLKQCSCGLIWPLPAVVGSRHCSLVSQR